MHYYPFNIGDYASHTTGLSLLEDLAYRRLIDEYYLSEQPLNGCSSDVARMIGMRDHCEEVDYVLSRFFKKDGEKWVQNRIEKEIEAYKAQKEMKSKAGKLSGKARRNKSIEQTLNTCSSPVEQNTVSVELTNNQEPITKNQEPITIDNTAPAIAEPSRPRESKKFMKPAMEDLITEFSGRVFDPVSEAQKFHAYYESNGWKVGKNAMKSWQATVTTWVTRSNENGKGVGVSGQHGFHHNGMPPKLSTVGQNARAADEYRRKQAERRAAANGGEGGCLGDIVGEVG